MNFLGNVRILGLIYHFNYVKHSKDIVQMTFTYGSNYTRWYYQQYICSLMSNTWPSRPSIRWSHTWRVDLSSSFTIYMSFTWTLRLLMAPALMPESFSPGPGSSSRTLERILRIFPGLLKSPHLQPFTILTHSHQFLCRPLMSLQPTCNFCCWDKRLRAYSTWPTPLHQLHWEPQNPTLHDYSDDSWVLSNPRQTWTSSHSGMVASASWPAWYKHQDH